MRAAPRRLDRLDGAHLVERDRRRTGDGPSRLDRRAAAPQARTPRHSRATIARSPRPCRRRRSGRPRPCRRSRGRRRGPARAASTPSSSRTSASSPTTRCAATSNPAVSKICEPMCECSPTSSSRRHRAPGVPPPAASPPASENPNFWSSCAVAMNSWVCASTPTVTRTRTRCRTPRSTPSRRAARSRVASRPRRARPRRPARPKLGHRLVVAVQEHPLARETGTEATASSPPVHTSSPSPSSSTQRATAAHRKALPA